MDRRVLLADSGCIVIEHSNTTLRYYSDSLSSMLLPRISKVLVALDGSESAVKAADYALAITKGLNAELIAIHAVRTEDVLYESRNRLMDIETVSNGDPALQKIKEDAQKWFNTIKEKSSANGIPLRTGLVISPTEIDDTIVDYGDRENVDLIVIGGGKSALKERLFGSTTSRVASQIKRPILVVK
jgi:nucleotide-binding universal stress UspA family protein